MKMKPNHCRIPALLLAGFLLFLSGCSSTEFYTTEEMMEMSSKEFKHGGTIKMKDLDKYRIVYPDSAGEAELELVHSFRDAVAEKTGVTLEVVSDMAGDTEEGIEMGKYEIVLGGCWRPGIDALLENYCTGAEGWNVIEKRLYIYKSSYDFSDNGMDSVVEAFISEVVNTLTPDDPVFFDSETDAYIKKNSATEQLILNGRPITEYEIVTLSQETWADPADDLRGLAKNLQWRLSKICGDILPIVAIDKMDKTADRGRIFVGGEQMTQAILEDRFDELFENLSSGKTAGETFWSLESDGDYVWLDGTSSYALMGAADAFLEFIMPPEKGMPVYEAELPAEPVVGEISEEIELLHIDFAEQPHDSWALERYVFEYHPDLLILENVDGWFSAEGSPEDDFEPFYTCIGKWGNTFLYCADRFEAEGDGSPVYNIYNDHAVLYDLVTGRRFTAADAASEAAETEEPVICIDLRSDDPLEGNAVVIFACEEVTEEVGTCLKHEKLTARLYRMTVEG